MAPMNYGNPVRPVRALLAVKDPALVPQGVRRRDPVAACAGTNGVAIVAVRTTSFVAAPPTPGSSSERACTRPPASPARMRRSSANAGTWSCAYDVYAW